MEGIAYVIAIIICLPLILFFVAAFAVGAVTIATAILSVPLAIVQAIRERNV